MKQIVIGCIASLVIALLAMPAAAGDFILQDNDEFLVSKPGSGRTPPMLDDFEDSLITVLEENYDKVIYNLRSGNRQLKQDISAARVKTIYYQPRGGTFGDAEEAMNSGDFATALEKFTIVTKSGNEKAWVRMNAYANMADILEYQGQWKRAIKVWDSLTRDSKLKRCKLVPEAFKRIITGSLNLGDVASAESAAKKLGRLPGLPEGTKGLADYYLIYIRHRQAEAADNKGALSGILKEYRDLLLKVEGNDALKEVATRARLGIGNCLVSLEQYGEAVNFFQNIAKDAKDQAVLAGAFNGLGQCYLKQQKWKDALLCFLRTETIYDVSPALTAQALYSSGLCFERMQGAGLGEESGLRARIQYKECIRRYPGTPYAQQAEQALPNIRVSSKPK